jgi:hypothetical protein
METPGNRIPLLTINIQIETIPGFNLSRFAFVLQK